MRRFYMPTCGPSEWRRGLADPARHWRPGRSAYEAAVAWEAASRSPRGLPLEVARVLDQVAELTGSSLVLAFPEHQVPLPGGGHASQTDLWALLQAPVGLISLAVEAKAGENFDRPVSEWLRDTPPNSGKPDRLAYLCRILGITDDQARCCRYQLLHRPVAAIREAERLGQRHAVFLVQSFRSDPEAFDDYRTFARQLGVEAAADRLATAGERNGIQLWIGWVNSPIANDDMVRSALL